MGSSIELQHGNSTYDLQAEEMLIVGCEPGRGSSHESPQHSVEEMAPWRKGTG